MRAARGVEVARYCGRSGSWRCSPTDANGGREGNGELAGAMLSGCYASEPRVAARRWVRSG